MPPPCEDEVEEGGAGAIGVGCWCVLPANDDEEVAGRRGGGLAACDPERGSGGACRGGEPANEGSGEGAALEAGEPAREDVSILARFLCCVFLTACERQREG